MAAYYLDTSAMVKRYAREQGTAWVVGIARDHDLYTCRITGPELIAALTRKVRTGGMAADDAARAGRAFRRHWQRRYSIVEVAEALTDRAMDLAAAHGLRGYDAVHLAAALTLDEARRAASLPPLTFLSADNAQRQAAQTEGLLVDDPNAHP